MNSRLVAEAILVVAAKKEIPVTKLKLMKLAYYVQGYHFAATGTPAFDEKILAWEHGPVIRELYDTYPGNVVLPFNSAFDVYSQLKQSVIDVIEFVVEKLGSYGAWNLVQKTHVESPWRNHLVDGRADNGVITLEELSAYFSDELDGIHCRQLAAVLDRADKVLSAGSIELPSSVQSDDEFLSWVRGFKK